MTPLVGLEVQDDELLDVCLPRETAIRSIAYSRVADVHLDLDYSHG